MGQPAFDTAVIGFGTVGPAIALSFALKGLPVRVYDIKPEALKRGMEVIDVELGVLAEQQVISADEARKARGLIKPIDAMTKETLKGANFILEAIDEVLPTKQAFFKQLDAIAEPNAVLATNTSALDVSEIVRDTAHPERTIGYHVTLPAHISTAVEVIRGAKTNDETLQRTDALAQHLGKNIIHVRPGKDGKLPPGHIWNRLQALVVSECLNAIDQGWVNEAEIGHALTGALAQRWAMVPILNTVKLGNPNTHANYMSEVIPSLPDAAKRQQLVDTYLRGRKAPFDVPTAPIPVEELNRRIANRDRGVLMVAQAQQAFRELSTRAAPDPSALAQHVQEQGR